mmetsp:Transcript_4409/g.5077  ORF Transcript_4409/g.5077 Transcript_4409/m.5077 type:complete len:849 (-) Transcript_4409:41-2587(-)
MSSPNSNANANPIIKYVPFQSKSDPSFWMKLGDHKLNTLRLTQDPIDIQGTFTIQSTITHRGTHEDSKLSSSASCFPGRMRFDQDSIDISSSITSEQEDDINSSKTDTTIQPNKSNNNNTVSVSNENVITHGKIQILNTLESFKTINKNELLNKYCLGNLLKACGVDLLSEEFLEDGSGMMDDTTTSTTSIQAALTAFYCLCHLDLKSHKVLYWFAFPVLTPAPGKSIRYSSSKNDSTLPPQCSLKRAWGETKVRHLHEAVHQLRLENIQIPHPAFFIIVPQSQQDGHDDDDHDINNNTNDSDNTFTSLKCLHFSFQNYENLSEGEKEKCMFAFLDITSNTLPEQHEHDNDNEEEEKNKDTEQIPVGWTLRNLIAYLVLKLNLDGDISIISYRPSVIRRIEQESIAMTSTTTSTSTGVNDSSILLQVQLPPKDDYKWPKNSPTKGGENNNNNKSTPYTCVGWELNARSKPGPRSVNLAPLLSPAHLAQQATDLNLKLMKWRMIPNLDLQRLSNTRVLLLGSGTLGCSVARTLLGWGVRHFDFVDNGKVSYSNPVRQNLFDLVDCERGGKDKAIAAAEALKRIAGPTIDSKGHVLTIPMPGHAFGEKEVESVKDDVRKMQQLIDESDVVFLLTDTRESRWLPTVMARASNKMMINAALGLDSWLVMRHGGNVPNNRLGCYFCNDVVAPENSTKNRTLDQQCTVTRPGLAPIASSMAVELMVSLLHHELKQDAPAPPPLAKTSSYSPTVQSSDENVSSPLGLMPHQIRGSIVTYTMMTPTVPAFRCCTGCCDPIVDAYKLEGFNFVQKVCACINGSLLEDVAGLTDFRAEATAMMEDDNLDWDEASDEEF